MAHVSRAFRSPVAKAVLGAILAFGCTLVALAAAPDPAPRESRDHLSAFRSDAELRKFLLGRRRGVSVMLEKLPAPAMAAPAAATDSVQEVVVTGARASAITNNQVQGVDEGDIVKLRGETMIILRRGRLFTVSIADAAMKPIDSINAYPPGVDARDDWYDEMLLSGDQVVVIGYSYARGGTEINRFRLGGDGHLEFEDAYQLKSNDYYSSRNYASRLIGSKLILYSPLYIGEGNDPLAQLPAMRRWTGKDSEFHRIVSATSIYIPASLRNDESIDLDAIHAVTTCDLSAPELDCHATGVLGPDSRTYYVSSSAVYLWVGAGWRQRPSKDAHALIYRMPLDGSAPQAVGARGAPDDQFAFQEDDKNHVLNVLVRSDGGGDAMWRPEFSEGSVALLRLPLASFADGSREVDEWRYRLLPKPKGDGYDFHERFVGDYVLYGAGNGWGQPRDQHDALVVAPVEDGDPTVLTLSYGVDRIEALGNDALVVGSDDKGLHFTSVELTSEAGPRLGDRYLQPLSAQAETRSHAFFFRPDDNAPDGASGVMGLPVAKPATAAYQHLFQTSAAMVFLRRDDRRFTPLGELDARSEGVVDDACVASCVDWYGNARPIFIGKRIFALLGYELVEGARASDGIHEVGRTSFAPERIRVGAR